MKNHREIPQSKHHVNPGVASRRDRPGGGRGRGRRGRGRGAWRTMGI